VEPARKTPQAVRCCQSLPPPGCTELIHQQAEDRGACGLPEGKEGNRPSTLRGGSKARGSSTIWTTTFPKATDIANEEATLYRLSRESSERIMSAAADKAAV
jgi:hypothetical protein